MTTEKTPKSCAFCGAEPRIMPKGSMILSTLTHKEDCQLVLRRKTAEEIVRGLAAAHYIRGESPDGCPFCGIAMSDEDGNRPRSDIEQHDPDCLYRMAREWVAEHPLPADKMESAARLYRVLTSQAPPRNPGPALRALEQRLSEMTDGPTPAVVLPANLRLKERDPS